MQEQRHTVGAAVVGQSGGPTAVINATLAGVIRASFRKEAKEKISVLYGMRNGVEGLTEGRLTNLTAFFSAEDGTADEEKLALLAQTPASALGSCRKKLPKYEDGKEFYDRLTAVFEQYNIRYFFYIGGNDSMDTVAKLRRFTEITGYDLQVIGLPKTIDNDLPATDHSPGYGSAAKLIATEVQEIVMDCAVYTVPAVTVVEIMGRNAGWLTAASGLARLTGGKAPDLIYLPEVNFDMQAFFASLRELFKVKPNLVIAVSEGIHDSNGEYVGSSAQSGVADVFGHKYLAGAGKVLEQAVKAEFGCKVRSVELSLPQRCGSHCVAGSDRDEALAVGEAGMGYALEGISGVMIAIDRKAGDGYAVTYVPKDVRTIANGERLVPRDYINEAGNNVTDECLRYLLPLIQGEVAPVMENGLPKYLVLPQNAD